MDTAAFDQTQYCLNKIKKKNEYEFKEELKNGFLSVVPSKLKFTFDFGNFEVQEKIVEITNYFSKSCPIRFLPLETDYFKIRNIFQRRWLNPGSIFKMNLLFKPDENRDYNAVLKICYFNDRLIEVRITAKTTTKFSFPTTVNFGNVPLGRTVYYKIPIYPHAEEKFSFAILPFNGDSCVDIYPRWGYIRPKQRPVIIMIIYRPLRYVSMNFQIRIFISDLCKAPRVINFYAYTRPGLLRETLENIKPEKKTEAQRKTIGATLRKKIKPISVEKEKPKFSLRKCTTKHTSFENILLKQCSHFHLSMHAVNCILNSKILTSFNEYELKGPLDTFLLKTMEQKEQKLKEFLIKVENHYGENEKAKFHHKPKINYGTFDADENQIIEIKMQREQAWYNYKNLITNSERDVFERQRTDKIRQKILRVSQEYPSIVSTSSRKEESFFHRCKIVPFLRAARKIILRNRLLKTLEKLQQMTPELINRFDG